MCRCAITGTEKDRYALHSCVIYGRLLEGHTSHCLLRVLLGRVSRGADIRSTVFPKYPLVLTTRSIRLFLRLNWEKVGKGREGHQDHDKVHRPEGSGGMSMTVHREGHLAFPKPGGSQNPGLPPSLGSPEIQFLFCMAKMEGVSSPCIERLCLVAGSARVCTCACVRAHMCLYVHTEGKLNVF